MTAAVEYEARIESEPDGSRVELLVLPTDERFLSDLLSDIFQRYWRQIVFGPMILKARKNADDDE